MVDDKKTLKFQMMMSPREAEVLDDWMFKHRVRSRAEAIRRLTQIGMALDRRTVAMLEFLASDRVKDTYLKSREELRALAQDESVSAEAKTTLYEAVANITEFENSIMKNLYKALLEVWPLKTNIPPEEAAELRSQFEEKLDTLPADKETDEILRMINIVSGKAKID